MPSMQPALGFFGSLLALALACLSIPAARAADPSSYVMLMLSEPVVEGDLPGIDLLLALSQQEAAMQACFLGIPGGEGPADEEIVVTLELDPAGHATGVMTRSGAPGDREILERCLAGVIRMASFPAPGGEGAHAVFTVSRAVLEEPAPRDFGASIGPDAPLQAGAAAPPLGLEGLLGAPEGAAVTWEALRGRVVVLEFWATWCGPCLASVPHLTELATEFEGQGVVFLSITDEDEALIRPFLERTPLPGWVGLDTDGSVLAAYHVHGIPMTVVVGPNGRVAHVGHPDALDAATLRAQLPDRSSTLPPGPE